MAEFPYTPNAASLERFFAQMQTVGKPGKVTLKWLEGLGFKSSNDRYIPGILKSLGFTDSSGGPTEKWMVYRDKEQARVIMAQALREAYAGLFETYPDAYRRDDEALRNFFSTRTSVGEKAVSYIVRTFKTLAGLAGFDAAPIAPPDMISQVGMQESKPTIHIETPSARGLTINVNIQLQLPATDDATIYDRLFEALKKHVLS